MIHRFLAHEAAGGVLLMVAALVALIAANSGFAAGYQAIWSTELSIGVGGWVLAKPAVLWINDALMAVFFLLVGLELKREVVQGELASPSQAGLTVVAAIGGMVVPGLIYWSMARGSGAESGWAIPVATDIAFVLGILLLLGSRVPTALKVFLTGAVIIDDIAAIAIIALFYTGSISATALGAAALLFVGLLAMNRLGVRRNGVYLAVGVVLWFAVLKSGLHATLAGVMLAAAIPLGGAEDESPLERLEHALHPWVAYAVLPIFALANAGVALAWPEGGAGGAVTAGVAAGLAIGKPLGMIGLSWLAVRSGFFALPRGTNWGQLSGVAALCGIGFTMSLFIGSLAFTDAALIDAAKVGIVIASSVSAVVGVALLMWSTRTSHAEIPVPVHATAGASITRNGDER